MEGKNRKVLVVIVVVVVVVGLVVFSDPFRGSGSGDTSSLFRSGCEPEGNLVQQCAEPRFQKCGTLCLVPR